MCNFIKDYPQNPTQTILDAKTLADRKFKDFIIDEELIWSQISSPEYRLYEEIIMNAVD